jgi:hypothetical protein
MADVQSKHPSKLPELDRFKFDMDRLYDISYEVDPDLVEFASSIDVIPSCLIRVIKAQEEQQPAPHCGRVQKADYSVHMLLPGVYETFCYSVDSDEFCRRVKTADHPYESYSDAELMTLSESSPEAAIILARRASDTEASARLYERAVALSGRPGPLEEWMYQKNTGGLEWRNGVLDVDKAKVGYGVYAITGRLGYGESALQKYRSILLQAGVDVDALDAEADEKFASLSELRKDLTAQFVLHAIAQQSPEKEAQPHIG